MLARLALRAILAASVLAVCVAVAGCPPTAPTTGYEHLNNQLTSEKTRVGLGPGDIFRVEVYGEKQLSGVYRVSLNGTIDFPLVGSVKVGGLTANQVADVLRRRLKNGYLRDPYVSVLVRQYNSKKIFVLGEVNKAGTFPYTSGMNVVEAITLAGGFKNTANPNYVVVTRRIHGKEQRIPVPVEKISKGLAANLELRAGDIVFVPDSLL